MANLAAYQKIDRVLPGQPFGNGIAGATTISSDPNTRATFTGTATATTGTAGSTSFNNGDVVLLHQTQGTGNGQYEFNQVSGGGGTTSLTFAKALNYTYVSGAQIIKVPMYETVTVSAFTPTAWSGSTGGITVICGRSSITVSGSVNGVGQGYRGGVQASPAPTLGSEGANGYADRNYGAAGPNESGGGGSGGGYGTQGSGPGMGTDTSGLAYGSADLTNLTMGGGGDGAVGNSGIGTLGAGGKSGHAIIFITKSFVNSSSVLLTGQAGSNGSDRGGGGGSGGAFLLMCATATLGTVTNNGGAKGTGSDSNANGGDGGVGRNAVHASGTVSGSTTPSYNSTVDSSLVETAVGGYII